MILKIINRKFDQFSLKLIFNFQKKHYIKLKNFCSICTEDYLFILIIKQVAKNNSIEFNNNFMPKFIFIIIIIILFQCVNSKFMNIVYPRNFS